MPSINASITRAIRERKWLQIEYYNAGEQKLKYFWICILDIDPTTKKFKVRLFNQEYSYDVKNGWIFFDHIRHADVIEGTSYEVPQQLQEKLQHNYKDFNFLAYSAVDERILQYYLKCYQQDRDAAVTRYHMVSGIDTDILKGNPYALKQSQFEDFVVNLKLYQKEKHKKFQQKIIKLAINVVSIHTKRGIYPIVYRDVLLDIDRKVLIACEDNSYNVKLEQEEQKGTAFQLRNYYDGELQDFIEEYESHPKQCLQQITENLHNHEQLDENPYIFKLEQCIPVNIEKEYQAISEQYHAQILTAPLKCFFGLNEKERKRKPRSILTGENETNADQLRSEFNAMMRDVVYVQGPPGTGKTRTIINVILSCLLNNVTALIVSNNNEAIDNIYRKLTTYSWQNHIFSLPVLRLGSNESIKETLRMLHEHLEEYTTLHEVGEIRRRIKHLQECLMQNSRDMEKKLGDYEEQSEKLEQLESLKQIIQDIQKQEHVDEVSKSMAINGIRAQIQRLAVDTQKQWNEQQLSQHTVDMDSLMEYVFLVSCERRYRLSHSKYRPLYEILIMEDEKERLLSFRNFLQDEAYMSMLLEIFPFIISTNISVTKLGKPIPKFELMIMDEASQCNNAQALLPMCRCKRAMFVGDQNQLQPVILLNSARNALLMQSFDIPAAYSYKDNSILSTLLKIDTLSKFILLREHFRCHDKIIGFANKKYYDNELKLCCRLHNVDALKLIDVRSEPAEEKNTSPSEVEALLHELKKNTHGNVAVITPFRKQAEFIERTLAREGYPDIKVGTIHTFQGDEKDRIILCGGISANTMPGSFNWMKNNQQLLNVATTRAKENLTLICDVQKVRELSSTEENDFLELIEYMRSDGAYEVAYRENEIFTSKVKNFRYYNVQTENELLKTLLHIRSVYGQINIKNRVVINKALHIAPQEQRLFGSGSNGVFDFVIYDLAGHPLAAIEITGSEHYSSDKHRERERRKQEICKRNHLKLITIGNDYLRRYSYIKQAILDAVAA